MKKIICALLIAIMLVSFAGCKTVEDKAPQDEKNTAVAVNSEKADIDLTQLSSTMVYSEVYNMMTAPENYIGKKVKMSGQFAVYQQTYFACVIADATACCQQGLEFILGENKKYPDDYPAADSTITVVGEFQTYYEGEKMYCHLVNAKLL